MTYTSAEESAQARARQLFRLIRIGDMSYDVFCKVPGCSFRSNAWDFHRNALSCGYGHAHAVHDATTERGVRFVEDHGYATVTPRVPAAVPEVVVGEEWEELARPGHTVEITRVGYDRGAVRVNYLHIGVHNKRAANYSTVTEQKLFLKRFKRISAA